MSLRLEMLQVARLAPKQLGDATDHVEAFVREQFHRDGGAVDRSGKPDLYYTVFALESLLALQSQNLPSETRSYLKGFGAGEELDLVHLACLARCWACFGLDGLVSDIREQMIERLASFRCADGGFAPQAENAAGTGYHSFVAFGAYQDLEEDLPQIESLANRIEELRSKDLGFTNLPGFPTGSTTVTSAALTLLRYLGRTVPEDAIIWLESTAFSEGGYLASPDTPLPDLLSTATALHALSGLHRDLEPQREPCLDFIDSLWTGRAFCGHWADDDQDCEYTYYALLALGHLSV